MISLEKLKILTPLQNLPRNVWDLGKLIADRGFKKLPKVQKIAKSGHTTTPTPYTNGFYMVISWNPFGYKIYLATWAATCSTNPVISGNNLERPNTSFLQVPMNNSANSEMIVGGIL